MLPDFLERPVGIAGIGTISRPPGCGGRISVTLLRLFETRPSFPSRTGLPRVRVGTESNLTRCNPLEPARAAAECRCAGISAPAQCGALNRPRDKVVRLVAKCQYPCSAPILRPPDHGCESP